MTQVNVWRRRYRLLASGGAAVVVFGLVYLVARWWLPGVLSWASSVARWQVGRDLLDQIRQLGAAGLALAAGGVAARFAWQAQMWTQQGNDVGVDRDAEAKRLASRVLQRVLASPVRMRSAVPMPLRVRFRSALGLGAGRGAVLQDPGALWEEKPLDGDVTQVARWLREEVPFRQLVVIGEPGAGKSVLGLLLVQQLLQTWTSDEPVPMLLAMSSWNPVMESVEQFVAGRLADDFGVPRQVAVELTRETRPGGRSPWWVMPVLDGLDELPTAWHEVAVQRLEQFAASDRPVVVTCRVREWEQAEAGAGALSRAAVVRLQPLQPDDVVEFLSEPAARRPLWEPVFAQLRARPPSLLAGVLSTPLMAGLARDVYARDGNPGELTAMMTRSAVTACLIDGYVDVVYRGSPWPLRGFRVVAGDALRWLSNLAFLAAEDGTRDLRWWRLPWQELSTRPAWRRVGASFIVMAGISGLAAAGGWLVRGWSAALIVGCSWVVLMSGCHAGWWLPIFGHEMHPTPPRWMGRFARRRGGGVDLRATFAVRVAFGLLCGAASGAVFGRPWAGAAAGVAATLVAALAPGRRWRPAMSSPTKALRAIHLLSAVAAARYGGAAAVMFAVWAWLNGEPVPGWSTVGVVGFAAAAAVAGGEDLWLGFRILHLRAAVHRRGVSQLPLRLVGFLNDGVTPERATLRVNGSAWQFRHAIIQDHLLDHSRPTILRRHADAGDWFAAERLAKLLQQQGNLDEAITVLRRHADADLNGFVAERLAGLLLEQGNLDELRRLADAQQPDRSTARQLAELLREQGNIDELRRRADAGDWFAAEQLADLYRVQGNLDEAIAVWRRHAAAGEGYAAEQLAQLYREQGNLDEAIAVLGHPAAVQNWYATVHLAELLREQGNLDELRRRTAASDRFVSSRFAQQLAELLREQGNLDELRRRAKRDWYAAEQLAGLLREQGNLDEAIAVLRRHPYAWDGPATRNVAELLREQGNLDEAIAVLRRYADAHDWDEPAGERLAELLREQGNLDQLRRRADNGDWFAAEQLAEVLCEQGNLDEAIAVCRPHADANASNGSAARKLAELLRQQDNLG